MNPLSLIRDPFEREYLCVGVVREHEDWGGGGEQSTAKRLSGCEVSKRRKNKIVEIIIYHGALAGDH